MIPASPPGDYDDTDYEVAGRNTPHAGIGAGHYVSEYQRSQTRVQQLREVVAEVTNGRIPAPERRGPRF